MRYTYRHIGILTISLIVASCSFSKKQANNSQTKNMNPNVKNSGPRPRTFSCQSVAKESAGLSERHKFGYMLPKERKSNNI